MVRAHATILLASDRAVIMATWSPSPTIMTPEIRLPDACMLLSADVNLVRLPLEEPTRDANAIQNRRAVIGGSVCWQIIRVHLWSWNYCSRMMYTQCTIKWLCCGSGDDDKIIINKLLWNVQCAHKGRGDVVCWLLRVKSKNCIFKSTLNMLEWIDFSCWGATEYIIEDCVLQSGYFIAQ